MWLRQRDADGTDYYTATFWFVPLQFFESTTDKLRFIQTPLGMEGVDMAEGEWLVTVGRGVMIACAIAYMFKHLPLKDWLGFCEKFGFPGVHGKTNARKGSVEWKDMKRAVANFMVDWGVVTTLDEAIELIEVKASGNNLPFDPLVDRMDRAITRLWRGADLGTMSRETETTGVSAQWAETELIEQDLAAWITETLNLKVDRKVIEYSFGPDAPVLAYVKVLTNERIDVEQEIKINNHLVSNGARLSLKNEMERFGRSEAKPDEEILQMPEPTDPAGAKKAAANEMRNGLVNFKRAELLKTAARQLGEARLADFMPFLNHVAQIASMSNPAAMLQAARNIRQKLPQYLKALNAKPAEAEVLAQTLSAEFFNGIDDADKARRSGRSRPAKKEEKTAK